MDKSELVFYLQNVTLKWPFVEVAVDFIIFIGKPRRMAVKTERTVYEKRLHISARICIYSFVTLVFI